MAKNCYQKEHDATYWSLITKHSITTFHLFLCT
jgi:hypothetical protein